ncbi:MAG: TetR family transcriptional regulator, partial [Mycobacterium sp.]|nr:TetR family transcriptional regulator [Mycobacterium sp.]
EDDRSHPGADPVITRIGAAMYTGAMAELSQQWLAGTLGTDLDAVVDHALTFLNRD